MNSQIEKQPPEEEQRSEIKPSGVLDPEKVIQKVQPAVPFKMGGSFSCEMQQITVKKTNIPTLPVQDIERLIQLNPDYAERAIKLVEGEAEFRRSFAKQREENVFQERILGLKLGTFVAVSGFVCGLGAAWLDHPWIASMLIGSSLLGVVSLIVAYSHGDFQKSQGGSPDSINKSKR